MILGLLEGIPTMQKGEIAMFKMKPELHYGEEDCPLSVSDSFPKDVELHFEIEMIDFAKVKARMISAKAGDGKLILSRTQGEPAFFTFGKSEVPKGNVFKPGSDRLNRRPAGETVRSTSLTRGRRVREGWIRWWIRCRRWCGLGRGGGFGDVDGGGFITSNRGKISCDGGGFDAGGGGRRRELKVDKAPRDGERERGVNETVGLGALSL
ncbi:Peptidyl-prolyl cis-trans isomerase [Actinidia chinensis var. chinensis]|uniref:peptidylprolyl isomerase n=1 Tax=Actinidia chinensis var. chinensis TaxID=1590841 RepID=A0A2R6RX58_ACTCC|nr:Peptidyl-prolyl cis-trans isomerase [Actinidia chinensis var. chinensis]